jgi:hypothetical protein
MSGNTIKFSTSDMLSMAVDLGFRKVGVLGEG